jgi:hypothetical protein
MLKLQVWVIQIPLIEAQAVQAMERMIRVSMVRVWACLRLCSHCCDVALVNPDSRGPKSPPKLAVLGPGGPDGRTMGGCRLAGRAMMICSVVTFC